MVIRDENLRLRQKSMPKRVGNSIVSLHYLEDSHLRCTTTESLSSGLKLRRQHSAIM